MSYKVEVSSQAEVDLRGIYEQIVFALPKSEDTKNRLRLLETEIMRLGTATGYWKEEKEPWKSRGLRKFPIGHFLLYYIVNEEMGIVTVIRVVCGGQSQLGSRQPHSIESGRG